jgi:Ala-tRNA(Pro) deacylase
MRGEKLFNYLKNNQIDYSLITHLPAYSSQITAHRAHVSGKEFAKPVIVKIDGKMTMVVVTSNQRVNLMLLKNIFKTDHVVLADETDLMDIFTDCELGAMPPFGNLYDMDEIISEELSKDEKIFFNAGTHTQLVKMDLNDFMSLVKPRIFNFKLAL